MYQSPVPIFGYSLAVVGGLTSFADFSNLSKAGCVRLVCEWLPPPGKIRQRFDELLEEIEPGDIVVVPSLSRLGRAKHEVVTSIEAIKRRRVHLRSVVDGIDTTEHGWRIDDFVAALARFEALEERYEPVPGRRGMMREIRKTPAQGYVSAGGSGG